MGVPRKRASDRTGWPRRRDVDKPQQFSVNIARGLSSEDAVRGRRASHR